MEQKKYLDIAKIFTYVELCHIEQALESFKPNYPINDFKVRELKENITAARRWVHHLGKCDRNEN